MKKKLLYYGLGLMLFFSIVQCAKRGTPSGGEKDTTPPKMIKAEPPLYSINFSAKKIRIYFDEYIQLKDIQKQLIISPPLKQLPEILPQGSASKYIDIKIRDTLKPNTTYVFNFGQSIVDNNEGNPYSFFSYVFSTGSYIDSLTISGRIKDAVAKKPDDFVSVMLYEIDSIFTDSVIYQKPPTYITNTLDSTTNFKLTNVKAGKYLLVAVKDENSNYMFNQKSEKIAFQEAFIDIPSDSIYELTLFKEITNYKATRASLIAKNRIVFGYEGDSKNINIDLLAAKPADFDYKITRDLKKDSLNYWFKNLEADSLQFKVSKQQQIDTFTVKLRNLPSDSLVLTRGNLSLKERFSISSNIPLVKKDETKMTLLNKDSLAVAFSTVINIEKNQLDFNFEVQPNERYKLQLLPNALEDFYGNTNDTLNYSLTTKSLADYGNITVLLKNVKQYPIILQLTDEKFEVIDEIYIKTERERYEFRNINPSKYYIRVIFDENSNQKWDTGNYLNKKQPERIVYLPNLLDLRPNWELEQEFILK